LIIQLRHLLLGCLAFSLSGISSFTLGPLPLTGLQLWGFKAALLGVQVVLALGFKDAPHGAQVFLSTFPFH